MSEADKKKVVGIFKMLKVCKLKQSTRDFVDSLERHFNEKGFLSPAQSDALFDIYVKA